MSTRTWVLFSFIFLGGLSYAIHAALPAPLISSQRALIEGDIHVVSQLVYAGADINRPNSKGVAPLHVVAQHGHAGLAELLINHGANVHARYDDLWTPLHLAVQNGHTDIVRLLLARGAYVNGPKEEFSPLHFAAQEGHLDVAKLLIAHGAKVRAHYHNGWTPLHLAAQEGHTALVELLLDHGADIHDQNAQGFTPLHSAAFLGRIGTTRLLLRKGAAVAMKDMTGQTPRDLAVLGKHHDVVKLLDQYAASTQLMPSLEELFKPEFSIPLELPRELNEEMPALQDPRPQQPALKTINL